MLRIKKYMALCFTLALYIFISGFSVPDWMPYVPQEWKEKAQTTIIIPKVNVKKYIDNIKSADIRWLYRRCGKDTKYYRVKINKKRIGSKKYKIKDIKRLMKIAYLPVKTTQGKKDRKAAILALEYSIYAKLYENYSDRNFEKVRNILYSNDFLERLFSLSKDLINYIPENIKDYKKLVQLSIKLNPDSFYGLTMRTKIDPNLVNQLFFIKKEYNNKYQITAIKYADKKLVRKFLARNGLLLGELPRKYKDDLRMVYIAVLQNEKAIEFATKRVLVTLKARGIEDLRSYNANLFMFRYTYEPVVRKYFKFGQRYYVNLKKFVEALRHQGIEALRKKNIKEFGKVKIEDKVKIEVKKKVPGFIKDKSVVLDLKVISDIEKLLKREIVNINRLARINNETEIFVVYFKPKGTNYLGSIIYKKNDEYVISNYPAIYSLDGASIWRVKDYGEFSPNVFDIESVNFNRKGNIEFILTWKGSNWISYYRLEEEKGFLIKWFIEYRES